MIALNGEISAPVAGLMDLTSLDSAEPGSYESLTLELDGRVAVVTLKDPEHHNAMLREQMIELPQVFAWLAARAPVRAVVLTGADPAFCAGGYAPAMAQMAQLESPARERRADLMINHLHHCILGLRQIPWPVIAAVNGPAVGAGVGLALACDLRVASRRARLLFGYARLGGSPDAGTTWFLPRIVGPARAQALLMEEPLLRPARALELGIVDEVVEHEELLPAALAKAHALAEKPPLSLRSAKALIRGSLEVSLEVQLEREAIRFEHAIGRPHFVEGVSAFAEGRIADFGEEW